MAVTVATATDPTGQCSAADQEWVVCDLCGADEAETVWTRGRFQTPLRNVVCRQCGLVYVNPRMSTPRYQRFYLEEYRAKYGKPIEPTPQFRQAERRRAAALLDFIGPAVSEGGRVLELGCRTGDVLNALKTAKRCEVYGVEPDHTLATFASHTLGLSVTRGLFEWVDYPEAFFDVVILCHVLEHCYSPIAVLQKIRRILKPGGTVYVEVPNIETPYGSLSFYFQNAHPYSFSPRTLTRVVQKAGFTILKHEPYPPAVRVLCVPAQTEQRMGESLVDEAQLRIRALREYQRGYWWTGRWISDVLQDSVASVRRNLRAGLHGIVGVERTEQLLRRLRLTPAERVLKPMSR